MATFAKENNFMFAQNNMVIIKTPHHKNLRAKPNDQENLDHQGGKGKWARWQAEKDGGNFKFKNVSTGKYLRLTGQNAINCGGVGGPFTVFKVDKQGGGKAKLESVKFPGKYISVKPNGNIEIGIGGAHTILQFIRKD